MNNLSAKFNKDSKEPLETRKYISNLLDELESSKIKFSRKKIIKKLLDTPYDTIPEIEIALNFEKNNYESTLEYPCNNGTNKNIDIGVTIDKRTIGFEVLSPNISENIRSNIKDIINTFTTESNTKKLFYKIKDKAEDGQLNVNIPLVVVYDYSKSDDFKEDHLYSIKEIFDKYPNISAIITQKRLREYSYLYMLGSFTDEFYNSISNSVFKVNKPQDEYQFYLNKSGINKISDSEIEVIEKVFDVSKETILL